MLSRRTLVTGLVSSLLLATGAAEAADSARESATRAVMYFRACQQVAGSLANGKNHGFATVKKKKYPAVKVHKNDKGFRKALSFAKQWTRKTANKDAKHRAALKAVIKKANRLKGNKSTTKEQWGELARACGKLSNEIASRYGI